MPNQVYVVEDDVELGEIMVEILSDFDAKVTLITNGKDAIESLTSNRPRLVFLDMHLPEKSGIEVLTFIRSQENLVRLPVIVITADAIRGQAMQGMADIVLIKPVTIDQILHFGKRFLGSDSQSGVENTAKKI